MGVAAAQVYSLKTLKQRLERHSWDRGRGDVAREASARAQDVVQNTTPHLVCVLCAPRTGRICTSRDMLQDKGQAATCRGLGLSWGATDLNACH